MARAIAAHWERVVISAIAVAGFAIHTWVPGVLPLDAIGVALLVIALLPWFRGIIKSVEVPGFKMELQEVKDTAEQARAVAQSAQRQMETLLPVSNPPAVDRIEASLTDLAQEYEIIRKTLPAGSQRTAEMDRIFREMTSSVRLEDLARVWTWFKAEQRGQRLAAYAAAFSFPDKVPVSPLIESVVAEDKPFGQYWGLAAIRRVMKTQGTGVLNEADTDRIIALRKRLPVDSDRYGELSQILNLAKRTGSDSGVT